MPTRAGTGGAVGIQDAHSDSTALRASAASTKRGRDANRDEEGEIARRRRRNAESARRCRNKRKQEALHVKQDVVRAWRVCKAQCSAAACEELERIILELCESDLSEVGELAQRARDSLRPRTVNEAGTGGLELPHWMRLVGIRPHELPEHDHAPPASISASEPSSSACGGDGGSTGSALRLLSPHAPIRAAGGGGREGAFFHTSTLSIGEAGAAPAWDACAPAQVPPGTAVLPVDPELAASPSRHSALQSNEDDSWARQQSELVEWYDSLFDT